MKGEREADAASSSLHRESARDEKKPRGNAELPVHPAIQLAPRRMRVESCQTRSKFLAAASDVKISQSNRRDVKSVVIRKKRRRRYTYYKCRKYRVAQKSKPLPNDQKIVLKPVSEIRFIVKLMNKSSTIMLLVGIRYSMRDLLSDLLTFFRLPSSCEEKYTMK